MSFKNLSMRSKLLLSLVPTLLSAAAVSIEIYVLARQENLELDSALLMTEIIGQQELEMVRMSEALRGYLIDPSNEAEFANKKQADANYVKLAEELNQLTQDSPDIQSLNKIMADFDSKTLDDRENKIADLIKIKDPSALAYYASEYVPARKSQVENFTKLKALVKERAQVTLKKQRQNEFMDGLITIACLWFGMILGVGLTIAVALRLTRRSERVFGSVNEVSISVAQSAKEILDEAGKLSDAANRQAAAIQETAASVNEISAMIKANSSSAEDSRRYSRSCKEQVDVGQASFRNLLESINTVRTSQEQIFLQVERSNQGISEITGIINQIEEKTRVINDIVFQTKLLSFNASVEAARAGEHGKGFAVVAEEVGNLARMSGVASKEITGLLTHSMTRVHAIIEETRGSVKHTIDDAAIVLDQSIEQVNKFDLILSEITRGVTSVDTKVDAISVASREQDAGVSEISKVMQELDSETQQTATISHRSAANAQKLSDHAGHLEQLLSQMTVLILGQSKQTQGSVKESKAEATEDEESEFIDEAA